MGITSNVSKDAIKQRFDRFLETIKKKQIDRLQRLGEMCVIEARTNKGYMMQTGALTSSTGYKVFVDGVAVHEQFEAASGSQGEAATKGMQAGQELADKVGSQTKGVALVVVAGMDYAFYVEKSGRNVLTSAEKLAERELPKMLNKLINNIKRAAE